MRGVRGRARAIASHGPTHSTRAGQGVPVASGVRGNRAEGGHAAVSARAHRPRQRSGYTTVSALLPVVTGRARLVGSCLLLPYVRISVRPSSRSSVRVRAGCGA